MTWTLAYIALALGAGVCLVAFAMMLVPHEYEITARATRRTKMRWAVSDMCFVLGACSVTVAVVLGLVEIVERIGGAG